MLISPHEQERLLIHAAGLARERRARGLRLNYPEAVAMITSFLLARAITSPRPIRRWRSTGTPPGGTGWPTYPAAARLT